MNTDFLAIFTILSLILNLLFEFVRVELSKVDCLTVTYHSFEVGKERVFEAFDCRNVPA